VLNYAPTVIGESDAPCLVLAKELTAPERANLEIYISNRWEKDISEPHLGYVSDMIKDFLSLPLSDIDHVLANVQDFSIGPLRLGLTGTCSDKDLHRLLGEIFIRLGYSALA
jgi:hypothetical protein